MPALRLSIFLRFPVAGEVKTRLIPALGAPGAARLYRRLAEHTVQAARDSRLDFELRVTGGCPAEFWQWLGNDLDVVEQGGGDLGARLARVPAPALVIGSDAPAMTGALLDRADESLESNEVVLGPAKDGGYYLIGFDKPVPFLFTAMEWSTPAVLSKTIARLEAKGIVPALLPELSDVDVPEDLSHWPELMDG